MRLAPLLLVFAAATLARADDDPDLAVVSGRVAKDAPGEVRLRLVRRVAYGGGGRVGRGWIDVHQHGGGALADERRRRRREGVVRDDDLVARPDPQHQRDEVQSGGPRRAGHGVGGADPAGQGPLKVQHPRTLHQLAARQDVGDGLGLLRSQGRSMQLDGAERARAIRVHARGSRERYQAMVRWSPSSRSTWGSNLRMERALDTSGMRSSTSA